eukprot:6360866-Alexandrium_andersonii.AAC.1
MGCWCWWCCWACCWAGKRGAGCIPLCCCSICWANWGGMSADGAGPATPGMVGADAAEAEARSGGAAADAES